VFDVQRGVQDVCGSASYSKSPPTHHAIETPPQKVTYSTLASDAIGRQIGLEYGFENDTECSLWHRGVSDTYLLSASGRRFALRISRANWRTQEAISTELDLLEHLRTRGANVTTPIVRRDGRCMTEVRAPEGIRIAVLFPWVPGRAPKRGEAEQARLYGKLVAEMHSAADGLPLVRSRPRMDLDYLLTTSISHIKPRLEELPDTVDRLDALAQRIRTQLDESTLEKLDWGFCHGDVHPDNARIDGEHIALFDFDSCGFGWRLLDLAAYRLDARWHGKEDVAWEPFSRGYLQIRPSAAKSLNLIGPFMILRYLWLTWQWIILSADGAIGSLSDDFFEELIPFCERVEVELPVIR
jgi:Ser/Thr protein kinase RdoA (MazF antagonist)